MPTKLPRPANNSPEDAWRDYWVSLGRTWRTEPEISLERQAELAQRRDGIEVNIAQGIYPFAGLHLTRADVEWLLSSHESNGIVGPVDWNLEIHRHREGLDLRGADLRHEDLQDLPLAKIRAGLRSWANNSRRDEWDAATPEQREAASAHFEGANLLYTRLEGAILCGTHFEMARLQSAHLESSRLRAVHLEGVNLNGAYFDENLNFSYAHLGNKKYGTVKLADVRWGNATLSLVDWTYVKRLGNELEANKRRTKDGLLKDKNTRLKEQQRAIREYRQVASILRMQGLNEEADRFAYRAQVCQRGLLRLSGFRRFGGFLWSGFLDLLAGYGYQPLRTFTAYLLVITGFLVAYMQFGVVDANCSISGQTLSGTLITNCSPSHTLTLSEAFIFSLTSFHGRGFFPGGLGLDSPITFIAAIEAVIGLIIEISFISTFTQRFFGR